MTMMDDDIAKADIERQADKVGNFCGCVGGFFLAIIAILIVCMAANSSIKSQRNHEYDVSVNKTGQKSWNEGLSSTEKWGIGGRSVMGPIDDYKSRNSLTPRMLMDSVGGSEEDD